MIMEPTWMPVTVALTGKNSLTTKKNRTPWLNRIGRQNSITANSRMPWKWRLDKPERPEAAEEEVEEMKLRTYNSTSKYAAGGTANRSARDAILAKTSGGLTTSMGTGLTEN